MRERPRQSSVRKRVWADSSRTVFVVGGVSRERKRERERDESEEEEEVEKKKNRRAIHLFLLYLPLHQIAPEARSFGGSRWENECDTTLVSAVKVLSMCERVRRERKRESIEKVNKRGGELWRAIICSSSLAARVRVSCCSLSFALLEREREHNHLSLPS